MDKDITSQVDFQNNDSECLPLTKCVCGRKFEAWDFILSIYRDTPDCCPDCGRQMYFSVKVTVYEAVADGQDKSKAILEKIQEHDPNYSGCLVSRHY